MSQPVPFTLPPGRIVWGSLYKPQTKDREGRPLVYKTGNNAGQPRSTWNFGIALPKVPGQHWATSPWGALLWQAGHIAVPNAGQIAGFAWKITDGDSAEVKQEVGKPPGKAPRDKTGYAGHWILALGGSFQPSIVNGTDGKWTPMPQPDMVLPGDYVQVQGDAVYNESRDKPGIHINPKLICFSGYGERIAQGVDPASAGFQTGVVAGAMAAPVGGFPATAAPPPAAPGVAAAPPAYTPPAAPAPAAAPPAYAPPAAPAPVAVAPNPAYAPPAAAPAGYAAPPPPPAAAAAPPPPGPQRVMTAEAGGVSYADYIKAGWTDQQLIDSRKMLP